MSIYFYSKDEILQFLVEEIGFEDKGAAQTALHRLVDCTEESYKRETICTGYLYNANTDSYYELSFTNDYDYGPSNYQFNPTELKAHKVSKVIEVTEYLPSNKGE